MSAASTQPAQLPEDVLRLIFSHSTKKDNASCARVCREWSNEALCRVWEEVEAVDVFNVLVPMRKRSDGIFVFVRRVSQDDWGRFDHQYAWRVQKLNLTREVDPSAWQQISYYRPRMDILPHLNEVHVSLVSPAHGLLFCHASVTKLSIVQERLDDFDAMGFSYIPSRAPNLTVLKLDCSNHRHYPHHDTDDRMSPTALSDLRSALQKLPHLTSLTILASWLRFSGMMDAILSSRLKHLEIFSLSRDLNWEFENPRKEFIDDVCSHYPRLQTLVLASYDSLPCHMAFTEIESILSLSCLRHLTLHTCPKPLNADRFISIFQALPSLTTLLMQSDDWYRIPTPNISISFLLSIIPFCRNLEELHVELDATSISLQDIADHIFDPFVKLRLLHMGRSPISSPVTVATFLGMILPEGCPLDYTRDHEGYADDDLVKIAGRWEMVQRLLPMFMMVRRTERERHLRSSRFALSDP